MIPPPPPLPSMANIDLEVLNVAAFISDEGNLFQIEFQNDGKRRCRSPHQLRSPRSISGDGRVGGAPGDRSGENHQRCQRNDNRLEGNSTETATATFLFRATVKKGRMLHYTVGFTDDGGHDHDVVEEFIFR